MYVNNCVMFFFYFCICLKIEKAHRLTISIVWPFRTWIRDQIQAALPNRVTTMAQVVAVLATAMDEFMRQMARYYHNFFRLIFLGLVGFIFVLFCLLACLFVSPLPSMIYHHSRKSDLISNVIFSGLFQ